MLDVTRFRKPLVSTSKSIFRRHRKEEHADKMPVDFTAYLLSASPPGFDFFTLRDGGGGNNRSPFNSLKPIITKSSPLPSKGSPAISDPIPSSHSDSSIQSSDTEFASKTSTKTLKKKVSFADDVGLSLIQVRVMNECSASPPQLCTEFLNRLTEGALAGAIVVPPLVLNFKQPASDYLAFRERVEKDMVSLENVILKDYNLMGTVKVKNVAFEKKVFVRVTFDNWKTATNLPAVYVPRPGGSPCFDTFSFEICVPPTFDSHKSVLFCVCYETLNQQYWDNNGGQNYSVTTTSWKLEEEKTVQNPVFTLNNEDVNWTDFRSWSYGSSTGYPYY